MDDLHQLTDGTAHEGIDKLVVGAVIHAHHRLLILRRSSGDDFLPGIEELPSGGVEPGEDLRTALARELAEEVGWHRPVNPEPGFVSTFDYVTGSGRNARQFTFALTHHGAGIVLSAEHTGYRWVTAADLDETDLTEESKQTIREWETHSASTTPSL